MPKVMYKCNPLKNNLCPKTHCFMNDGPCTMTRNYAFAAEPVIAVMLVDATEELLEGVADVPRATVISFEEAKARKGLTEV